MGGDLELFRFSIEEKLKRHQLSSSELLQKRLTISLPEAAALLGISAKTLYNQVSAGKCSIPTVKVGGRRLIRVYDLEKAITPNKRKGHNSSYGW